MMRIVDETEQKAMNGGHLSTRVMLDVRCQHCGVEVECALLAMPMSEVLSTQRHDLCHTIISPLSLWRIIDHPIASMSCAPVALRVCHLRWSHTLAWKILGDSLECLYRFTCRSSMTIACAGLGGVESCMWYLNELQTFSGIATSYTSFSGACIIERRRYTLLALSCWSVVWLKTVNIAGSLWTSVPRVIRVEMLIPFVGDVVTLGLSSSYMLRCIAINVVCKLARLYLWIEELGWKSQSGRASWRVWI